MPETKKSCPGYITPPLFYHSDPEATTAKSYYFRNPLYFKILSVLQFSDYSSRYYYDNFGYCFPLFLPLISNIIKIIIIIIINFVILIALKFIEVIIAFIIVKTLIIIIIIIEIISPKIIIINFIKAGIRPKSQRWWGDWAILIKSNSLKL